MCCVLACLRFTVAGRSLSISMRPAAAHGAVPAARRQACLVEASAAGLPVTGMLVPTSADVFL